MKIKFVCVRKTESSKYLTKSKFGNPADEIIKLTQESNFDLIVMASRRITSRILGSTTRKVIDTVKKPTLIIPHMSSESEAF